MSMAERQRSLDNSQFSGYKSIPMKFRPMRRAEYPTDEFGAVPK
jgi:hypothetical protein